MSAPATAQSVIVRFGRRPEARHRLICLPYAGGGASVYRGWAQLFPPWLDVVALRPPGRESRIGQAPVTSMPAMVADLADWLVTAGAEADWSYSLFGHSLGALTSFELVREMRRRGHPGPRRLFVSGRCAPHVPHGIPHIHELPDREFVAAIQAMGGMPDGLLDAPDLLEALLPCWRGDFAIADSYHYEPGPPLTEPVSAFGGQDDDSVSVRQLLAWQELTTGSFAARLLPGDHFFIRPQAATVAAEICAELEGA